MTSFFRVETVDADAAQAPRDAIGALRAGDLHAVLVRRIYPPEVMKAAVQLLEANRPGFMRSEFPAAFRAFFYGLNLNLAPPDLSAYFAAEPAFRKALAGLVDPPLEERIAGVLAALDEGRAYLAPPGPGSGQRHFFTTLRAHRTGGYIPEHFDNESAVRPSYRHVARRIRPAIYSFVLAFSRAERGGALEFFDLRADEHGGSFRNIGGPRRSLDEFERVSIRLSPGDMIIVNSGGFLHRVTPVEGERTRWTACSFMAPSRDGDVVYCWG